MYFIQHLKKSKYGFTLIELIVVIAILAILAAVIVPSMVAYLMKSQIRQEESDTRSAYSAACSAYTSVMTDGKRYSDAQLNDAIVAQTSKLIRGNTENPPLGKAGHIELEVDRDRGIVWVIYTGDSGCECLYDASVDVIDDPFLHGGTAHNKYKNN